jgi:hypothetical protein
MTLTARLFLGSSPEGTRHVQTRDGSRTQAFAESPRACSRARAPMRRAAPLDLDPLARLLEPIEDPSRSAGGATVRYCCSGFAAALRRSELVALDVEDLAFDASPAGCWSRSALQTSPGTRTSPSCAATSAPPPRSTTSATCSDLQPNPRLGSPLPRRRPRPPHGGWRPSRGCSAPTRASAPTTPARAPHAPTTGREPGRAASRRDEMQGNESNATQRNGTDPGACYAM